MEESVSDLFAGLEFAYRKETPGFVRNVLREWGLEYTNDTGELFEQTFIVSANGSLMVGEVSLTAQSAITANLLADVGNQVNICRKLGRCDTSGKELLFNVPVPATTPDLPGEDNNLVINNNSKVPVEVRVRIEN